MQSVRPADEDRLPWLVPYRETRKPGKPLPRRGYGKPLAFGAGIGLLLAVGAGGYWLGQRGEMPAKPRPSATIALPSPKPAPVEVAEAPPPVVEPAVAPSEPVVAKKAAPKKRVARRHKPPRRKIHSAGVQQARLNAVRAAQTRQALRRPWPKMPSPGPAGQVIQLGAFTTPARANNAYYQRVARYKSLGAMPKVVVPVVTKPSGRILYVLRLGTTSRQQSKTVCRNLQRSGDHCLVIG
jgi:hypothetical protein